jgi:hypothetical protein
MEGVNCCWRRFGTKHLRCIVQRCPLQWRGQSAALNHTICNLTAGAAPSLRRSGRFGFTVRDGVWLFSSSQEPRSGMIRIGRSLRASRDDVELSRN